jgi:hypothetical protein
VATVAFAVGVISQLLLAAGIIPITWAWGGTQTTLTVPVRLACLAAAVILAVSAYVIRRRAGLSGAGAPGRAIRILAWVITVFLLLNTLGNLASPSLGEKLVFGPVSLIMAVCCLVVSLSKPGN